MQQLSTVFFALAIIHTFLASRFRKAAARCREGSTQENLLHLLGEVEVVFGFWAAVFFLIWAFVDGPALALDTLESTHFNEAVFVFVIMAMSSTKPILDLSRTLVVALASLFPLSKTRGLVLAVSIFGPLLGSFITEPAAMTVSCYLLLPIFDSSTLTRKAKYLLLGLLFVNISIGGTLTHFAAPPVLIVAASWNWDTSYMLLHFGWRSICAVLISSLAAVFFIGKELDEIELSSEVSSLPPRWVIAVHLSFIALAVLATHHIVILFALFLFFLGWVTVADEFQTELHLRESLLVGFFLAGLVVLGRLQEWWIQPLISSLSDRALFWGATALTAISDNALITYLGTLAPNLTEAQKYSLVSGAVCGGGLTVIANAPNPIGYSVLGRCFGESGIEASKLFLAAIGPTLIAALMFRL